MTRVRGKKIGFWREDLGFPDVVRPTITKVDQSVKIPARLLLPAAAASLLHAPRRRTPPPQPHAELATTAPPALLPLLHARPSLSSTPPRPPALSSTPDRPPPSPPRPTALLPLLHDRPPSFLSSTPPLPLLHARAALHIPTPRTQPWPAAPPPDPGACAASFPHPATSCVFSH